MAYPQLTKLQLFFATHLFLLFLQHNVLCYQYKVGDLDAWGIPTSANKHVYNNWSKKQTFKLGDSLLFLYPPSQDSMIQVTEEAFKICDLKDPILYMDNGNSLFNITTPGKYYFTSGAAGHCEKSQKLEISVLTSDGSAVAPADGPSALADAAAPSYQNAFGGAIPSTSSASGLQVILGSLVAVLGMTLAAGLMN